MSEVNGSTRINAGSEKVWEVISDYGNIQNWSPAVVSSALASEQATGVGAARTCDVPGFGNVEEKVTHWTEGESFTFEVTGVGPLRYARSTWHVAPEGAGARVSVRVEYRVKFGPLGALLNAVVIHRKIGSTLKQSLQGLKHHVETGEIVGTEVPRAS